mmetsp:Transcript_39198/g.126779  ORF Transcript_39198/g.126779 Transcript_39198/m.126779 type:complete len:226 (-) Transcript_39198:847-1524(-)
MDTFITGSACSSSQPQRACPASWKATTRRSYGSMVRSFFSMPAMTRSIAASKHSAVTTLSLRRAAMSAASLHTLAISAPEKPGVRAAIFWDHVSESASSLSAPRWTRKISARPVMSGLSTTIWRSNRPGRSSAGSRTSARLVPARTTMPEEGEKPSSSISSWLSVFSRSSLPPLKPPLPRARPTASISSMKMRQGALARACAKRSRTRAGPTPTNISMKSEPEME